MMMTDSEILELAYNHLHYYEGENGICEWAGDKKYLLEFARAIRAQSFREWYGLSIGDDK